MPWQIPVILRLFTAYVVAQPLVKVLGKTSRAHKFLLQFLFCAAIASAVKICSGAEGGGWAVYAIMGMAVLNATAAYCQWNAVAFSLSKYALFSVLDDIIPIVLTIAFLKEYQYLTVGVVVGSAMSLLAFVLFAIGDYRKEQARKAARGEETGTPFQFYLNVLWLSVVWGLMRFGFRYFALNSVPKATFLNAWYTGCAFGAVMILLGTGAIKTEDKPLSRRDVGLAFILAMAIFASLGLEYWGVSLAPLAKIQPIYLVGEMVLPAFIGLIFFGEKKELDRRSWCYFAIGVLGGFLIFLS